MSAVGVPFADRGRRTDEYLDAMTALWTMDRPAFEGRYASFRDVDAHPRPVRPGGPADPGRRAQSGGVPASGGPRSRLDRHRELARGPGGPSRRA
ncbi:LLM class flavin-dependent oxidoreductase [Streptomyces avermitilis]|uniref:LLM class flavin-dependent oxidoreductase n=1 Tax=Streptomyces avermitilis TaxID=33903 RepID=UPI0036C433C9